MKIQNLKFKILFLVIIILLLSANTVKAVEESTVSASSTPKKENIKEKIEDLKERVATKVAELRKTRKRGFFGKIIEKEDDFLKLSFKKEKNTILVDEDTKIFLANSNLKKTLTDISSLKLEKTITVFGHLSFDLEKKTLAAKTILIQSLPSNFNGKVKEADLTKGVITVETDNNEVFVLDYEIKTKCFIYNKDNKELKKCGLSKINVGDLVFVRARQGKKENRFTINRILILPSQSPAPTPNTAVEKE